MGNKKQPRVLKTFEVTDYESFEAIDEFFKDLFVEYGGTNYYNYKFTIIAEREDKVPPTLDDSKIIDVNSEETP